MSHTDKDRPYGIQVSDPDNRRITKPYHEHHGPGGIERDCTYDDPAERGGGVRACGRMFVNESVATAQRAARPWRADHTSRAERHSDYWGPDRARRRDTNRLLARQHNTGLPLTEQQPRDHRRHTFGGDYWG